MFTGSKLSFARPRCGDCSVPFGRGAVRAGDVSGCDAAVDRL